MTPRWALARCTRRRSSGSWAPTRGRSCTSSRPGDPADGRYGDNPNRLYKHHQLQLILKPPPHDIQDLYLESLVACGIDPREHDIRFEEDNWESPTLGAWGIGWQVLLDGLEISQFTYFQQAGGIELAPISGEITYGLERLDMYLQNVDNVYDLEWALVFCIATCVIATKSKVHDSASMPRTLISPGATLRRFEARRRDS